MAMFTFTFAFYQSIITLLYAMHRLLRFLSSQFDITPICCNSFLTNNHIYYLFAFSLYNSINYNAIGSNIRSIEYNIHNFPNI